MGLQETMRALADPTRRGILELLRDGELTAGEISERFPMSNAAVSKHLAVLKEAGYSKWVSIECKPLPDSWTATQKGIQYLKEVFR